MGIRTEQKRRGLKAIGALLSATITILWIAFFGWTLLHNAEPSQVQEMATGWSVSVNGQELAQQPTLEDYRFSDLQVGDTIVLKGKLPETLLPSQAMTMLCYLSTIEVKVDDVSVYHYGQELAQQNKLVGSGYHFITLPDDAAGKDVTIIMETREPDVFTSINNPTIMSTNDVYREFAKQNTMATFIDVFLILLGAVVTVVSSAAICYSKVYERLLYIGIFSFLMGVWSMCNLKIFEIFKISLEANTTVEYMSLYLAAISVILMTADLRKKSAAWKQQVVYASAMLMGIFFVVASILHFTNIEHYPRLLGYFHLFGGVSFVLIALTGYERGHKMNSSEKAIYVGTWILCASVALDLLRFYLQKYIMPDVHLLNNSVMPVGTLIFIIMLIVSYIFYVYDLLVYEAEQEWLTERAYHDELCKTFNRTKCNERFDELDAGKQDYALINLDLNGLKETNDSLGHVQGDLLLQEFASVLKEAFSGIGEVYRMGGDEFLVILQEEQFPQIDSCLNKMVRLEKRRSSEFIFTIEAAYGVAKNSECPEGTAQKVYMLADSRMYDMKAKQKINKRLR